MPSSALAAEGSNSAATAALAARRAMVGMEYPWEPIEKKTES